MVSDTRCCFCGGIALATTEDHQPARSIFDGRRWPEGYSFPACRPCNDVSRKHENVFALLTRLGPGFKGTDIQRAELQKYIAASSNNFPGLIEKFTTNQKREFYRAEGLQLEPGLTFYDLPMVGVDAKLTSDAAYMILTKLFCALHFKHTGNILPREGGIFIRWITNGYTHRADHLREFLSLLELRPSLRRAKIDLSDQFDYQCGVDPNGRFSGFFCTFRTFLMGYGLAFSDASMADDSFDRSEIFKPLNWDGISSGLEKT